MAAKPYRRLPGRGRQTFGASTLWEADDHLLLVTSTGFSESYRRFFYRDIGAIVVTRTRGMIIQLLIFGVIALLFAVGALAAWQALALVLWILAGAFALVSVITLLLGPTCKCSLRTPVQTHPLPSITRLRTARKVLARITPRIEAAQAILT